MDTNDFKLKLVEEISNCDEILGIGQTGDMNAPLIAGKSDIDLFIICKNVPDSDRRLSLYKSLDGLYDKLEMEVCSGGVWGYGDMFYINGIDVMPMYFSVEEFLDHFLQALYAKNRRYFPSRKRTESAIAAFGLKPQNCYERLLKVVNLGSNENTIDESVEELQKLYEELLIL